MALSEARTGRILLVDDDEDVRSCMRMILEDEGYEVVDARDGPSALVCLRGGSFDVLLVDYRMPGMSGPEMLASAREQGMVRCPVLLITASEDPGDAAERAGADGMLAKPFQLEDLLALVASSTGSAR